MDDYFEQSASGQRTRWTTVLYGLCWALIALLVLIAFLLLLNVTPIQATSQGVRWPLLALALVCLALAVLLFYRKDFLRMDYDFVLRSGALEIWGILNLRRRRMLYRIPLERITRMGVAGEAAHRNALWLFMHPMAGDAARRARTENPDCAALSHRSGVKVRNLCTGDGPAYYICYAKDGDNLMAILPLSGEMLARMRASGRIAQGAWQVAERKNPI